MIRVNEPPPDFFEGFDDDDALEPIPPAPRLVKLGPDGEVIEAPKPARIQATADLFAVSQQAIRALAEHSPSLYHRDRALVRVVGSISGPAISSLTPTQLRGEMSRTVEWFITRHTKDGTQDYAVPPPKDVVAIVHESGDFGPIRELRAVVNAPLLRPDGTIVAEPGYDPATRCLFLPAGVAFRPVPQRPTPDDLEEARAHLDDLVDQFPFASEAARAAWVSALLSPFARHAFEGNIPLFAVTATAPESGKTLLVDLIHLLFLGTPASKLTLSKDPEEAGKVITTQLRKARPILLFDNVKGQIGGEAIEGALTAGVYEARLLGTNESPEMRNAAVWFVTANNPRFSSDMARRIVPIPLARQRPAAPVYKHENLVDHVLARRVDLVWSALTILRAGWLDRSKGRRLPSFERWCDVVARSVCVAGWGDPLEARSVLADADDETAELELLLDAWAVVEKQIPQTGKGVTVNSAVRFLSSEIDSDNTDLLDARDNLASLTGALPGRPIDVLKLGKRMASMKGRLVGVRRLSTTGIIEGRKRWTVETTAPASPVQA